MSRYERCALCTLELRGGAKKNRQLRPNSAGALVLPPKAEALLVATLAELDDGTTKADLSEKVHKGNGFKCFAVLSKEWDEIDAAASTRGQPWKPAPKAERKPAAPRDHLGAGPDDASVEELFGSGALQVGMRTRGTTARSADPQQEARAATARQEARAALERDLEAAAECEQAPVEPAERVASPPVEADVDEETDAFDAKYAIVVQNQVAMLVIFIINY